MTEDEIYERFIVENPEFLYDGLDFWDEEIRFIITDTVRYKVFLLKVELEEIFKPLVNAAKEFAKKE